MAEKKLRESQVDLSRIDGELEAVNIRIDGLGKVFNYKGRVDYVDNLPSSGNKEGDLYLVGLSTDPDKAEYFWTGSAWEYLGNTSNQNYATETAPGISQIATTTEVNAGTNNTKYVTPSKMKAFVDNKISTKADLVNGKVPDSQLPASVTSAANKTLSNVSTIDPNSKVKVELNGKVSKSGDTITGDLIIKKSYPVIRGVSSEDLTNTDGMCLALEGKDKNKTEFARIDLYRRASLQQSEAHLIAENVKGQRADFFVGIKDDGTVFVDGVMKDCITERFSDDNGNWYKVYASGWVEQGGEVLNIPATSGRDITFLKPFANTLYTALCTPNITTSDRGDRRENWGLYKKASTYCQIFNNSETKTIPFSWYACGQGA